MASAKELADFVHSQANIDRINEDYLRYQIFNGRIRITVKEAISREFTVKSTVEELHKRVIPLNITQKITNKLAGVYRDQPVRTPASDDPNDQESIDNLTEILDFNTVMKTSNKLFKLTKSVGLEPYVNSKGEPKLRALPSHTITQFSDDDIEPEVPTHTIKHLRFTNNRDEARHVVWSEEEHYLMDGNGRVLVDYGNPYGINPIVYIREGLELMPIPDDDLLHMQIAICLLLTDLAFATKYAAWSVVYLIGVDNTAIEFNPNSVISLPYGKDGTKPEIGTVTPTLKATDLLAQVEALVGLLLTTKNLSVGTVTMKLEGGNAASGAAKAIDQSESTEDQTDQQGYFISGEMRVWSNLAMMMDVWAEKNMVNAELVNRFTEDFKLSIRFKDPAPPVSTKEQIETEAMRVEKKLGTRRMALQNLYPEMDDTKLSRLEREIENESGKSEDDVDGEGSDTLTVSEEGNGSTGSNQNQPNGSVSSGVQ